MKCSNLIIPILVSLLFLAGCEQHSEPTADSAPVVAAEMAIAEQPANAIADDQVIATILEFDEVETGVEPYRTRMTVSERYIRIDDSAETDGFVLFDREKKRIFSVVHSNESILVVDPARQVEAIPDELKIHAQLVEDDAIPAIAGVQPSYYQFYANDKLCYHLVAVQGFLPDISTALQAYQRVLAAQQQETLLVTPPELQTPCFLANYIYAPNEYMSRGFPLEQWDVTGYRRRFTGVEENVAVDKSLFTLPEQYRYMSVGSGALQM